MRFNRWGGTILLFVLSAAFLSAQSPSSSLTEEQAVHEALAANLGLQGEGIKSGIKKRDRDQAWSRLYPTLSVGGGYVNLNDTKAHQQAVSFGTSPMTANNSIEITPAAANVALSFSAQLAISPATFAAIDQTAVDYDNSKISYELAAQRLTRDVKKIFFQIEVLQATIALTEKQLANAEERYRQAQVNFKTGLAPQLTVLQAQVAWQNQKPALEDLKVNTQQALFTFENLLGRTPDADLKLVGSLDVAVPANALQAQPLIERFMDRRLDLKAAEGQVRAADGYKKIADQALFPALVLQYTADPTLNDPFGANKSNWGDTSKWLQPTGVFAVLLNWRLDTFVPGSASDNQRSDSADQGRLARTALDQMKLSAKTEIITLVNKIQKSTVAFQTLSANVDVALQAYKLTEDAYKSGARSLLEVQDAELQYQVAQLSLLNEKQLYHSNLLDLETALNSTSEEIYGR